MNLVSKFHTLIQLAGLLWLCGWFGTPPIAAQSASVETPISATEEKHTTAKTSEPAASATSAELLTELKRLRETVDRLEGRIKALESEKAGVPVAAAQPTASTVDTPPSSIQGEPVKELSATDRSVLDFWNETTVNLTVDGYYGYNFNRPAGRINLLRANDVTSNSFNLNQATLVVERAPDVKAGRRFGVRLDLQYGQATETLQGSAVNENRPQVYRPVLQAYGTYVFPVGNGVTVDFGKWVSALGIESNFTKDQMNYSRAFYFNFLPFYHFGFRTNYAVNDKFNITHWLVNGANQSEDFNGFKSQALLLNFKPTSRVS